MRDSGPNLEVAVARLSRDLPDLRFGWGGPDAGFHSLAPLSRLDDGTLDAWLAATESLAAGLDRKTSAAYLLSILTWQLGQVLGALYLSRLPLPRFDGEAIGIRHRLLGAPGSHSLDFDFSLKFEGCGEMLDRAGMSASMVALATPLIDGLFVRTRLARRAMWSLLTDGISAGFLAHGKRAGEAERAMAEAEAILRRPDLPLFNPRWHFVTVEAGGNSESFRLRGGCCRLYRSPGIPFCTTCVLRDETDQVDRLKQLVGGRAG